LTRGSLAFALAAGLLACHGDRASNANANADDPLAHATQLVTAVIDDWHDTHATMRIWKRHCPGDFWEPALPGAWQGVIGRNGAAWPERRREGDGTSPAGAFPLGAVFGYAAAPPDGAKMPYTQSDASWHCVDDSRSPHYAQIVSTKDTPVDWTSAEDLRRDDGLYQWVVEVVYNRAHTPDAGSCIFLHVWQGPGDTTVGCTAMSEDMLRRLLFWLDPAASPMYVLLPRAEYDARIAAWGLPPR
jgi:L,D-peptidoglycan transpeptidase YkuD (ErfK/YbiS/YcfS/YnhG family)